MGVERPERMTRVELRDEIVRRSVPEERQAEARGLFGVARSMIASVVDKGLNLPDAAKAIRGGSSFEVPVTSQTPVATVTLAEIYAAQGHKARALRILEDVLVQEPGHEEALRVQQELRTGTGSTAGPGNQPAQTQERELEREALTREAPPVKEVVPVSEPPADLPGESTEYVPGGFVETTGEEIETGRPPVVEEVVVEEGVVVEDMGEAPGPLAQEEAPASSERPTLESGARESEAPVSSERLTLESDAPDSDAHESLDVEPSEGEPSEPSSSEASSGEGLPEEDGAEEARVVALVLSQTPSGLALYWELPDATLDECSVDRHDGRAVARIVSFSPHGAAPERHEDTVILTETIPMETPSGCQAGKLTLSRHGAPSFVRAALGWESEDGFLPFTVGRSLEDWKRAEGGSALAERAATALF